MKQTIKQINKHYTMQERNKILLNTSVSNTILQNILYLMYLKSYFCCDPNSMRILCGWKIYGDNCDLFLSSRDFKCKERNWEFTKVHEGRCDLHFRLLKRFQNCFAENMDGTFIFSFSFYLLIIFLYQMKKKPVPRTCVHSLGFFFTQQMHSLWIEFFMHFL